MCFGFCFRYDVDIFVSSECNEIKIIKFVIDDGGIIKYYFRMCS